MPIRSGTSLVAPNVRVARGRGVSLSLSRSGRIPALDESLSRSTRKRFTREREALGFWSAEQTKIEKWHQARTGAEDDHVRGRVKGLPRVLAIQNRSHESLVSALGVGSAHHREHVVGDGHAGLVEDVKLRRAQDVAHRTVDKDLSVLNSFFKWCIAHVGGSNPVRRVKFFDEDNSRLRSTILRTRPQPAPGCVTQTP